MFKGPDLFVGEEDIDVQSGVSVVELVDWVLRVSEEYKARDIDANGGVSQEEKIAKNIEGIKNFLTSFRGNVPVEVRIFSEKIEKLFSLDDPNYGDLLVISTILYNSLMNYVKKGEDLLDFEIGEWEDGLSPIATEREILSDECLNFLDSFRGKVAESFMGILGGIESLEYAKSLKLSREWELLDLPRDKNGKHTEWSRAQIGIIKELNIEDDVRLSGFSEQILDCIKGLPKLINELCGSLGDGI